MERPIAVLGILGALALAAGLDAARLEPLERRDVPRRGVSCKAIERPEQTQGCAGLEIDLSRTADGEWILAHGPLLGGRPIDSLDSSERGGALTLGEFLDATEGRRWTIVNLDLKERAVLPGRALTRALDRARPRLEKLLARTEILMFSAASPARYAEIHRFLRRRGLDAKGAQAALEVLDYTPRQAERWGLALKPHERAALPLARAFTSAYRALNARAVPWYVMQETTAAAWTPDRPILCWSREPSGEPPAACRWTERPGAPNPSTLLDGGPPSEGPKDP